MLVGNNQNKHVRNHCNYLSYRCGRDVVYRWVIYMFQSCMNGNNVQELFPLFFLEGIDCWMWGFVAGLYQTYEPWENYWKMVEEGRFPAGCDITKWQHDLIRPSLRPYDPREIEIIRHFAELADRARG